PQHHAVLDAVGRQRGRSRYQVDPVVARGGREDLEVRLGHPTVLVQQQRGDEARPADQPRPQQRHGVRPDGRLDRGGDGVDSGQAPLHALHHQHQADVLGEHDQRRQDGVRGGGHRVHPLADLALEGLARPVVGQVEAHLHGHELDLRRRPWALLRRGCCADEEHEAQRRQRLAQAPARVRVAARGAVQWRIVTRTARRLAAPRAPDAVHDARPRRRPPAARVGSEWQVPHELDVIDLTPRFLDFYERASHEGLDPDARWTLWQEAYGFAAVPPTPEGSRAARALLDAAWDRYPAA